MNMDKKPSEGFEKLAFLLQQIPFPPVTFGNLLLLYCKYEYFDLAADVMAENAHLTYKFLTPVRTTGPFHCPIFSYYIPTVSH
uniref:Tetratricopeptide repeat protein 30 n=1 Tax=Hucho hucho TaxID=62062 RepID=A0A4W5KC44_9TELE